MEDYCEGCIHYVLQAVTCSTDKKKQIAWEPVCMAIQCIKGGKYNAKYESGITSRNSE
ncbi:hypothetical protein [Clostridium sporogenes]|uniref:hypothetical protein n=1 Tax=Clostridium sporogenes TaxID=1509 RepID=UPI0013D36E7B|nr:hypothetical protein [Clostridium sporogenes]